MAKPVWTTSAGSLGTVQERTTQSFTLDATNATTFSLQSGTFPGGLRLESNRIIGTPFEVSDTQTSKFVIRASNTEGSIDRTFTITTELTNYFGDGSDGALNTTP